MTPNELRRLTTDALATKRTEVEPLTEKELIDWYDNEFIPMACSSAKRGYSCVDIFGTTRNNIKFYQHCNELKDYLLDKKFIVHGFYAHW